MQRIGLQLRATLENITRLRAEGEDFRWYLKVRGGRGVVGSRERPFPVFRAR